MNKITIVSIGVLVFVGGLFIFYNLRPVSNPIHVNASTTGAQQKWDTKIDEQANITVVVTPLDLSPQSTEWKFDIGMNTHSAELTQDMMKSVVLVDDQGKKYRPIKWEGPVGGHHREGVLSFNPITPTPTFVTLEISDMGGVVRNFSWQLK